jgi:putative ABC transport system ATP-binding protein
MPRARELALEALEAVGLADRARHYPAQLSGGEQQRVALARAFAARPRVILADEPTGNLDSETGTRVVEHLFSLQQQHGTTLVLITHDKELALRCARQVRMEDGRLVTPDTTGVAENRP